MLPHDSNQQRSTTFREESIYHLSEAAKKGHGRALGYALEKLLFIDGIHLPEKIQE